MKTLIISLIILALGIWLGILVHHDSGYVLVSYQHWSLETSLWVAIAALFIALLAIYLLLRLISWLLSLSTRFQRWSGKHKQQKSQQQTQSGLCLLAEGNWKKSEETLTKAAKNQPIPLINYLACARAAQEQQDFPKRDEYLKLAFETSKDEEVAIALTQAQLQMSAKQWEQALATLRHLQSLKPNHSYVLKCLQAVYVKLEDWQSLQQLLPQLKKFRVLTPQKYNKLEKATALARLNQFNTSEQTSDQLTGLWKSINKNLHDDFDLLSLYIDHLIALLQDQQAFKLIDNALKRSWHSSLVEFIPRLANIDANKRLSYCEQWYQQHPKNATLLYCLGNLCEQMQLWGKAKDYLESCIAQHPQQKAYLLLGNVYAQLSDNAKAQSSYKKGLEVSD